MKWRGIDDTQDRAAFPVARPPSATAGLSPDLIDRARRLGPNYADPHGLALLEPLVRDDDEPGHTRVMFTRIGDAPQAPIVQAPVGCTDDTMSLAPLVAGWCADFINQVPDPTAAETSYANLWGVQASASLAHTALRHVTPPSDPWFYEGPTHFQATLDDFHARLGVLPKRRGGLARPTSALGTVGRLQFSDDTAIREVSR